MKTKLNSLILNLHGNIQRECHMQILKKVSLFLQALNLMNINVAQSIIKERNKIFAGNKSMEVLQPHENVLSIPNTEILELKKLA